MSLLTVKPSSGTEVRRWHFRDGISKREKPAEPVHLVIPSGVI